MLQILKLSISFFVATNEKTILNIGIIILRLDSQGHSNVLYKIDFCYRKPLP